MIRIGICDDEEICREQTKALCREYYSGTGTEITVEAFESGEQLLESECELDILFLDIEMQGVDGIRVKDRLGREKRDTRIIFLTSHDELKDNAFGRNVMCFLNKPIEKEKFVQALDKVTDDLGGDILLVEDSGIIHSLRLNEIKYIEGQGKYTNIITTKERLCVRRPMNYWGDLLPSPYFCRINHSYFVNFRHYGIKNGEVLLEEGNSICVSRKYKASILEMYKKYLRIK